MYHLYETVISNSRIWLKIQASCASPDQATAFFQSRFTGNDQLPNGSVPVTPFKLSRRSHFINNWTSIQHRLPAGWDNEEFHILATPYPWCKTLSDHCDCHGSKGRLDAAYCSDLGLHDETDPQALRSTNIRHDCNIRDLEEAVARRDAAQKEQRRQKQQRLASEPRSRVVPEPTTLGEGSSALPPELAQAFLRVRRLATQGFYCSIDGRHHPYSEQVIRKTLADLSAAHSQVSAWAAADRQMARARLGDLAAHWLRAHQSDECAHRSFWGEADVPDILYKYFPKQRIGNGAPDSLRATQLLALNDVMECNVSTMRGTADEDALSHLSLVQTRLKEHLGIEVPWEELLSRWLRFADVRLSTYLQEYLNPRVGVVALSTDILVPTMWAHYAQNTGIVVGYATEALRGLGFELRPVVYSEIAPTYLPSADDAIRLDYVDREYMEHETKAGRSTEGMRILSSTGLAKLGSDWQSLSRVLLVKGMSWAYEKEVRLLVDLERARDTGKKDNNGWPVKVVDIPAAAIREIYGGTNTADADVRRAVQVARGENKEGLFVGRLTAHAFRIQKTGGTRH